MLLNLILLLAVAIPFVQTKPASEVVNSSDGVPIHYSVAGKGEPALVFIHCWGCNRNFWENQVAEFSKTNRVVTIDMPGHGESGSGRKPSVHGASTEIVVAHAVGRSTVSMPAVTRV